MKRSNNSLSQSEDEEDHERACKRLCCDTPPIEPGDLVDIADFSAISRFQGGLFSRPEAELRNEDFLTTIQLKVMELQNDLDEMELKFNEDNFCEYDETNDESEFSDLDSFQMINEAETCGYAVCARETLLFLEREGVSINDELYHTLRNNLLSRVNDIALP